MEKYAGNAYYPSTRYTYILIMCNLCLLIHANAARFARTAGNPWCNRVNRVEMFLNRANFQPRPEAAGRAAVIARSKSWVVTRDERLDITRVQRAISTPGISICSLSCDARESRGEECAYCAGSQIAERSRRMQSGYNVIARGSYRLSWLSAI